MITKDDLMEIQNKIAEIVGDGVMKYHNTDGWNEKIADDIVSYLVDETFYTLKFSK